MPYSDKEKRREYQNNWCKKRRDSWLEKHGPCVECGSWDNLEIHHKDPTKKISHRIWSWSMERIEKELEKCEVRCHTCHNKLRFKPIPHGTYSGHNRHRCWCKDCMDAYRAYHRKRNRARRATI